jgi:hypothetical protein
VGWNACGVSFLRALTSAEGEILRFTYTTPLPCLPSLQPPYQHHLYHPYYPHHCPSPNPQKTKTLPATMQLSPIFITVFVAFAGQAVAAPLLSGGLLHKDGICSSSFASSLCCEMDAMNLLDTTCFARMYFFLFFLLFFSPTSYPTITILCSPLQPRRHIRTHPHNSLYHFGRNMLMKYSVHAT